MDDERVTRYLWLGGWLEDRRGWWHPPYCMASFPPNDAYRMAKEDEERGLRMTLGDLMQYHLESGLRHVDPARYAEIEREFLEGDCT